MCIILGFANIDPCLHGLLLQQPCIHPPSRGRELRTAEEANNLQGSAPCVGACDVGQCSESSWSAEQPDEFGIAA